MIQCQKCGAQNNEESVHCCSCGEKLDKGIICSKCGCVRIPEDAIYCPICGKSLELEFFNVARKKNTITAYQNFLRKFNSGDYCDKAKDRVNEIKESNRTKREEAKKAELVWDFLCWIFWMLIFAIGIGIYAWIV